MAGRFAAAGQGRPLSFFGISTDMHRFMGWIVLCVGRTACQLSHMATEPRR